MSTQSVVNVSNNIVVLRGSNAYEWIDVDIADNKQNLAANPEDKGKPELGQAPQATDPSEALKSSPRAADRNVNADTAVHDDMLRVHQDREKDRARGKQHDIDNKKRVHFEHHKKCCENCPIQSKNE